MMQTTTRQPIPCHDTRCPNTQHTNPRVDIRSRCVACHHPIEIGVGDLSATPCGVMHVACAVLEGHTGQPYRAAGR
jgi:hypothetical protein